MSAEGGLTGAVLLAIELCSVCSGMLMPDGADSAAHTNQPTDQKPPTANPSYDSSADMWSLGITMLEMANGHAPFAKFPPMKVLLMTLQNPPPSLEDKSGRRHFSKHMRDVVAACLQKDPAMRPTATELLQHRFFKVRGRAAVARGFGGRAGRQKSRARV